MNLFLSLIVILIFLVCIYLLKILKSKYRKTFNFRVLTALAMGLIFGFIVQLIFGATSDVAGSLTTFMSIFGDGYITLLKMIVLPLIFVAMTTSIMNATGEGMLAKIAPKVIGWLMVTVSIAAVIGILAINIFPVDAQNLQSEVISTNSSQVQEKQASLVENKTEMEDRTYADYILNIIPSNIVYMASGQSNTSTLSTVLFSMFLGYSILQIRRRKPEKVQTFVDFMNGAKEVVLSMVREILKLTPFAILAIMASFTVSTTLSSLITLVWFLVASYVAIITMYLVHLIIISLNGLSPKEYAKKTWPVLVFAFGSRSSMAAMPLNIETQVEELGVDEETASISATFGTSIGQNGCAGIYPAMVAIMAAQIGGVTIDLRFLITLIIVIAISSFGIAGVGGGATFAAVAVLSIMGLDVSVAALLVSIEPLIDMARTALNTSDSMVVGIVTAKNNKTLNIEKYNN